MVTSSLKYRVKSEKKRAKLRRVNKSETDRKEKEAAREVEEKKKAKGKSGVETVQIKKRKNSNPWKVVGKKAKANMTKKVQKTEEKPSHSQNTAQQAVENTAPADTNMEGGENQRKMLPGWGFFDN